MRTGPILLALACAAVADPGLANPWQGFVDTRMRFASVSQENALSDAEALTARLRAGATFTPTEDWQLLADVEGIADVAGDYNSTTNGESGYSVIPDPDGLELNRAQVRYSGLTATEITIGRQRIKLDNDRMIGNVGWRQNEQTYDSAMIQWSGLKDTIVRLGYLERAHRVLGDDHPNGNLDLEAPIINVRHTGLARTTLVGYGYFLDFEDAPITSHRTIGVRARHDVPVGDLKVELTGEYARQDSYRDGHEAIDAEYRLAEVMLNFGSFSVGAGQELLGGDGSYGFQTPLATAHAFNGWSDQFLVTPANGLDDRYIALRGSLRGLRMLLRAHWFDPDTGGEEYGTELEGIANYRFNDRVSAGIKFARYSATAFGVDTTKVWAFATVSWQ